MCMKQSLQTNALLLISVSVGITKSTLYGQTENFLSLIIGMMCFVLSARGLHGPP